LEEVPAQIVEALARGSSSPGNGAWARDSEATRCRKCGDRSNRAGGCEEASAIQRGRREETELRAAGGRYRYDDARRGKRRAAVPLTIGPIRVTSRSIFDKET